MGLLENMRRDIAQITTNKESGWAAVLLFTMPTAETFTINGLHSKHRITIDGEGKPDNAKNAHVSFAESAVVALGFSIRNSDGLVHLKDWTVRVADSTGVDFTYRIREWWPSETTGLIVCLLGDIDTAS